MRPVVGGNEPVALQGDAIVSRLHSLDMEVAFVVGYGGVWVLHVVTV
jgi:hypothetical protein